MATASRERCYLVCGVTLLMEGSVGAGGGDCPKMGTRESGVGLKLVSVSPWNQDDAAAHSTQLSVTCQLQRVRARVCACARNVCVIVSGETVSSSLYICKHYRIVFAPADGDLCCSFSFIFAHVSSVALSVCLPLFFSLFQCPFTDIFLSKIKQRKIQP